MSASHSRPTLALLALVACNRAVTPTDTTPPATAPAPIATAPATTDPAPDPAPALAPNPQGVLQGLENGDRACYVQLETAAGQISIEGDFDLCPGGPRDASKLVGKAVITTTEKASVLAASCGGDVDCGKSDVVDVVTEIRLADGTAEVVALDDLDAEGAVRLLGKPAGKSSEEWAVDGVTYTTWKWAGVDLITNPDGVAHSVTCEAPCALRTKLGIGLGSTADEVRKAYGKQINRRESNAEHLRVGDIYGGIFFDLKAGKVVRIFIGTNAE